MKPDYAGLRQYRKARDTGRVVGVYDGIEAGMDTTTGRWQTVCEEHGTIVSHETLALARAHAADPLGWCERCQAIDTKETPEMTTELTCRAHPKSHGWNSSPCGKPATTLRKCYAAPGSERPNWEPVCNVHAAAERRSQYGADLMVVEANADAQPIIAAIVAADEKQAVADAARRAERAAANDERERKYAEQCWAEAGQSWEVVEVWSDDAPLWGGRTERREWQVQVVGQPYDSWKGMTVYVVEKAGHPRTIDTTGQSSPRYATQARAYAHALNNAAAAIGRGEATTRPMKEVE